VTLRSAVASLAALLCACAPTLYTAPDLTANEPPARLVTDSDPYKPFRNLGQVLWLTQVDGESTYQFCWRLTSCWPEEASVSKGFHVVKVHYAFIGGEADGQVSFDAESGRSYIVRKQLDGLSVRLWVEPLQ
jgi:hypothetical protein